MRRKILTLAFIIFAGVNASAQTFDYVPVDDLVIEDNNRDAKGGVVRGSYLTNKFNQNWQFTVLGGGHTLLTKGNGSPIVTPRLDLQFAKWITPTVGFRVGAFVGPLKENRQFEYLKNHSQLRNIDGVNMFRQSHGYNVDILFSASNMIWGYRQSRRLNVVPFFSGEYFEMIDHDEKKYFFDSNSNDDKFFYDLSVSVALGVDLQYALNQTFSLAFDVKDAIFSNTYHANNSATFAAHRPSMSAGIVINFGKRNRWLRVSTSQAPMMRAAEQARAAAVQAEEKAQIASQELNETKKELEQVQSELKTQEELRIELLSQLTFEERLENAGFVSYFEIGSTKLSNTEEIRLMRYVQETLKDDPQHVFYLAGSADKGTGSLDKNMDLAERRSAVIAGYLTKNLGVKESQIVIRPHIVSEKHEDGRYDRCVLIENE